MAHISDQIHDALVADGWKARGAQEGHGIAYDKIIVGWAPPGGVMVPDGRRRVYLRIDGPGRYLERVDGWNNVEKDIDLRKFNSPAAAIAAILVKG